MTQPVSDAADADTPEPVDQEPKKTPAQALLAWLVTYGGVPVGISMLIAMQRSLFDVVLATTCIIVAPVLGIVLAFSSIRRSMSALQMLVSTARTKALSISGLILSLSFFIVPIAVVTAVSLWAFMLPNPF